MPPDLLCRGLFCKKQFRVPPPTEATGYLWTMAARRTMARGRSSTCSLMTARFHPSGSNCDRDHCGLFRFRAAQPLALVNGGGLFVLAGGAVSTFLAGSRAPPRQPPRITDRLGNKHRAVDAAIVKVR
jgi:hypothetical protein